MPELIIGSPPRGEDYFGQEELIENIWSKLDHDNVLLVAPRRFGKTGAMYRLLDEPRRNFRPLYMDVEHIEHAADFMIELIANLIRDNQFARVLDGLWKGTKTIGKFIRDLPANIDLGGVKVELRENTDVPKNWLSYGERVMSLLSKDGPPLLLLIDEFAVMINTLARSNESEMKQLLRWFRSARIAPETQTRFVIGGSINLINTLDAIGLVDTVNDLSTIRLRPFSPQTARRYVEAIFKTRKVKVKPETVNLPSNPKSEESFMQLMYKLDNDFYVVAEDHAYDFFSRVIKLWWKNHYGFQGE